MKVKELRSWLNDFGEKHKQHYKHQLPHSRQKTIGTKEDDLLAIQSKPSNASTSPTSSSGSVSSAEADPLLGDVSPASTVIRTTTLSGDNIDHQDDLDHQGDQSCYSDPSFGWWSEDDSSFEVDEKEDPVMANASSTPDEALPFGTKVDGHEEYPRRVTFGGIQGMNTMSSDTMESVFIKRASLAFPANRTLATTERQLQHDMSDGPPESSTTKPVFRKRVDPKELPFLQPKTQDMPKPTMSESSEMPKSGVGAAIRKFGGLGCRKTIVEKRKDELERHWSETRTVTHVKKTKWCVCEKTGVYRKKIVVEAETKIVN